MCARAVTRQVRDGDTDELHVARKLRQRGCVKLLAFLVSLFVACGPVYYEPTPPPPPACWYRTPGVLWCPWYHEHAYWRDGAWRYQGRAYGRRRR